MVLHILYRSFLYREVQIRYSCGVFPTDRRDREKKLQGFGFDFRDKFKET